MVEPNRCLICYQGLDASPLGGGFSTVSKELNAVFILRNIFEVPLESLSDYMVDNEGTNPSEWIRLCGGNGGGGGGTCKIMVDKAKRIYKEMLDANRRFRKVKGDIIQFLRRNQKKVKTNGGDDGGLEMEITNLTRKFVSEHDYSESLVDPFIGGDCQAEKLLYSSNIVPEVDDDKLLLKMIKVERFQQENYEEDDGHEESQETTYCNDNGIDYFEEIGDQTSLSSPPSTQDNDDDDDKDPLYTTSRTSSRKGRKSASLQTEKEEIPPHIPSGTSLNSDGEEQWNCSCGRVYSSQMQLRRHVKEATMEENNMYSCPLCVKRFRRRWDVKRHLSHTHKEAEEEISVLMANLPSRKRKGTGEEGTQDETCTQEEDFEEEEQAPDSVSLSSGQEGHRFEEESQKMEDGTEYWKCSCGKIYLKKETLLKHVQEVTMGKKENEVDGNVRMNLVNCTICEGTFKRRFELNRHMKLKHGLDSRVGTGVRQMEKKEGVSGGGEGTFEEESHVELGLVATLEDGTEQWNCSCGKSYGSRETMSRHVREKNMDPSEWVSCPHCGKSFKRRSLLKRHVDGVHGKENKKMKRRTRSVVECELCGESFAGMGKLKIHQSGQCPNAVEECQGKNGEEEEEMEEEGQAENREEAEEMIIY